MNVRVGAAFVLACLAAVRVAQAAPAALDVTPVPGGPPTHLRLGRTSPDEPPISADIVLRRLGPTSAMLERNTDVLPLVVGADGSLRADPSAVARSGDLLEIVTAIAIRM